MCSTTLDSAVEVQRLVDSGLLTKAMSYRFDPDVERFLSFQNFVQGRRLIAEVSFDLSKGAGFELRVTEEAVGQKPEIVSVRRHESLEHLVRAAKGFLCHYNKSSSSTKKGGKIPVTVRVDEDLRAAFEAAAEAMGESGAVVLRQLMRYFAGMGTNPKLESNVSK